MADQFCRIACANICDMSFNGDGIVCLITTDANTSYVIRDIFKEDEAPDDILRCYKGDLIMDGVTVLSNLSTSSSGSLIVPPNTVLCYKENSGNYPLSFAISKTQVGGNSNTTNNFIFCCSVLAGASAASHACCNGCCGGNCLSTNICCSNNWNCGVAHYDSSSYAYAAHYYDGNSVSNMYIMYKQPQCTSYTMCWSCYGSYCTSVIAPDMGMTSRPNCSLIHNWKACGFSGFQCVKCVCNWNPQGRSTYGKNGMSMIGRCGCCACRAAIERAQDGGTISLYHFNYCNCCSGNTNVICSYCIACIGSGGMVSTPCFCSIMGSLAYARLGIYYSKLCDQWMPFVSYTRCLAIAEPDFSKEYIFDAGADMTDTNYNRASDDGKRFWWWLNCSCKHAFVDLDSVIQGVSEVSYLSETPYTTNSWCCAYNMYVNFVSPSCHIETSGTSCSYPSVDCDTKIRIYGIKST